MEFRQVEHFLKLFKLRNVTKASQELFISQQGLSKSIQNLEDELELPLFTKSQRGAFPTDHAEALKPYFELLIQNKQLLFNQAEALRTKTQIQEIHIACSTNVSYNNSILHFKEFQSLFPSVRIVFHDMIESKMIDAINLEKCHFALCDPQVIPDSISHGIIFTESYCAVMNQNHPLAKERSLGWSMLDQQDIALEDASSRTNREIHFLLEHYQVNPKTFFEPDQIFYYVPKILQDHYIGIICPSLLKYFNDALFVALPLETPILHEVHLISKANHPMNNIENKLIEFVQHTF